MINFIICDVTARKFEAFTHLEKVVRFFIGDNLNQIERFCFWCEDTAEDLANSPVRCVKIELSPINVLRHMPPSPDRNNAVFEHLNFWVCDWRQKVLQYRQVQENLMMNMQVSETPNQGADERLTNDKDVSQATPVKDTKKRVRVLKQRGTVTDAEILRLSIEGVNLRQMFEQLNFPNFGKLAKCLERVRMDEMRRLIDRGIGIAEIYKVMNGHNTWFYPLWEKVTGEKLFTLTSIPVLREKVRVLVNKGMSSLKIARKLHVGLPNLAPIVTDVRVEEVMRLIKEGKTASQIEKRLKGHYLWFPAAWTQAQGILTNLAK